MSNSAEGERICYRFTHAALTSGVRIERHLREQAKKKKNPKPRLLKLFHKAKPSDSDPESSKEAEMVSGG